MADYRGYSIRLTRSLSPIVSNNAQETPVRDIDASIALGDNFGVCDIIRGRKWQPLDLGSGTGDVRDRSSPRQPTKNMPMAGQMAEKLMLW